MSVNSISHISTIPNSQPQPPSQDTANRTFSIQESTGAIQWACRWFSYGKNYLIEGANTLRRYYNKTPTHSLADAVENQILNPNHEKITTYQQLDLKNRCYGVPKLKRAHIISDPEMIKSILNSPRGGEFFDSGFHEQLSGLLGVDHMLLSSNEDHARLRRPLDKFFAMRSIESDALFDEMTKTGLAHCKEGDSSAKIIYTFVFLTLLRTIIGLELKQEEIHQFVDLLFGPPTDNSSIRKLMHDFYETKEYDPGKVIDILKKNETLTEEEKISTIILLFAAGTHTTINFIHFFLHMLHANPSYRSKILAEWSADRKFQTQEEFIDTFRTFVKTSKWLEACYLECTRLFPILPDVKRVAKKNTLIGNVRIDAGDEIHLNILASQCNQKEVESDSAIFNPDNFLNKKDLQSLTFSTGRQRCLGMFLAKLESKILGGLVIILFQPKQDRDQASQQEFSNNNLMNYNGFNLSATEFPFHALEMREGVFESN